MNVKREEMKKILAEASPGLSPKKILEQSDCFVFTGDQVMTFNDEIMVCVPFNTGFKAVLPSDDLVKLLGKFDDEEIVLSASGDKEVLIEGRKKKAGLTNHIKEGGILLPTDSVPPPSQWTNIDSEIWSLFQQASRTCGRDESQYLTTVVHVSQGKIEACDNHRLFVATVESLNAECLIPAVSLDALREMDVVAMSLGERWVFFRSSSGAVASVRCNHGNYHKGVDDILAMEDPREVKLPPNLNDVLSRAEVMTESGYLARVEIQVSGGKLLLSSNKEGGWYREEKRISYDGPPLSFIVNPQFLCEVLEKTRFVHIDKRGTKMMMRTENTQFVVSLVVSEIHG